MSNENEGMPEIPEASFPEEATKPEVVEPEDIDPGQWLAANNETVTGVVVTRVGRLKIAGLTEAESDLVRKSAESIDPMNPRGARKLNISKMRLSTICASVNKAYGYGPADPKFLTPDKLRNALGGEVTTIVNKITELGGFKEDDQARGLDSLFQLS